MEAVLERSPVVAGQFYPDDPDNLSKTVKKMLAKASSSPEGELIGLIAPHAGYVFSGNVAAESFHLLEEKENIENVILVGPSHSEGFYFSSVLTGGYYTTPLGEVPVNSELAKAIVESGEDEYVQASIKGHAIKGTWGEHCLEVQLPFLQSVLKDFSIVPILMGNQSYEMSKQLAESIVNVIRGTNSVLVASTDLSHYHSYREARKLDSNILRQVRAFNPRGIAELIDNREAQACGSGPVMTVMMCSHSLGADSSRVLEYKTSADSPYGDYERVVGYMAAAFEKKNQDDKPEQAETNNIDRKNIEVDQQSPDEITQDQKISLLRLARAQIRSAILGDVPQPVRLNDQKLSENMGAFVTIKTSGKLRGCIGFVESDRPLSVNVAEAARAAATRDPRFSTLNIDELDDTEIEISLLSPMSPISPEKVNPGKHGLWIIKGYNRGLLLPQVASERKWDRETFLENICLKASLPGDSWREKDIELYSFTAVVFKDGDFEDGKTQNDKN